MTIHLSAPEEHASFQDLARELYEAYIEHSGGKAWDGRPCPTWEGLNDAVRSHWVAAAARARELLAE